MSSKNILPIAPQVYRVINTVTNADSIMCCTEWGKLFLFTFPTIRLYGRSESAIHLLRWRWEFKQCLPKGVINWTFNCYLLKPIIPKKNSNISNALWGMEVLAFKEWDMYLYRLNAKASKCVYIYRLNHNNVEK